MSLDTNTNLKGAIADWLNRTDLTTQIVDFIRLTESRITADFAENNLLNKLLTSETITTDATSKALDSGYRGTVVAYLNSDPKVTLNYLPPDEFFSRYLSSQTGKPAAYTIDGSSIHLGPSPDASYDLIHWFVKMPDLATDETNSVLTNYPNLYLYGALSEGFGFLGNETKALQYEGRYLKALDAIQDEARNLGPLQVFVRQATAGEPRPAR